MQTDTFIQPLQDENVIKMKFENEWAKGNLETMTSTSNILFFKFNYNVTRQAQVTFKIFWSWKEADHMVRTIQRQGNYAEIIDDTDFNTKFNWNIQWKIDYHFKTYGDWISLKYKFKDIGHIQYQLNEEK